MMDGMEAACGRRIYVITRDDDDGSPASSNQLASAPILDRSPISVSFAFSLVVIATTVD